MSSLGCCIQSHGKAEALPKSAEEESHGGCLRKAEEEVGEERQA